MSGIVAVIGGGPAGIAAATRAAECGQRVVLLDESPEPGGQIWRHQRDHVPAGTATKWLARLERSGAEIMRGTAVVDASSSGDDGFKILAEQQGIARVVRADALILATGARERFIPFPGWTLPGVIGVGAAQALLKTGVSFRGKRVVIAGSGPLLLPVAAALTTDGARVQLVAEQAARCSVMRFALGLWRDPSRLAQAAGYRARFLRTPYKLGTWIIEARGGRSVEEVDVTDGTHVETIPCDVLCAAFGLVPNVELARLLGCNVANGSVTVNEHQETTVPFVFCAGESTGIGGMELSSAEGEIAGMCAAGQVAEATPHFGRCARLRAMADAMNRAFVVRPELRGLATPETIICRCEDVPLSAIDPAWSMRKAKLYSRAGMGACQGRTCGPALEFLHGWAPDSTRLPCAPALYSTIVADATLDRRGA